MTTATEGAHNDVYAVDGLRTKAMVEGDLEALSVLIDRDCCYVHSTGSVDTKDSYLQRLRTGEIDYKWITCADQSIIDLGGSFAIPHRMEASIAFSGVERPYQSRAVAIWRTTPDGLLLVYFQATVLPL
jgi:hypothetical protein